MGDCVEEPENNTGKTYPVPPFGHLLLAFHFALALDFCACDEFVARGSQVCVFTLEVTLAVVLPRERLLAA